MKIYFSILLTLCFFCTLSSAQTKIYVDQSAAGTASGTTWTNAYTDLHTAINQSNTTSGSFEIWVAAGTYFPTVENGSSGSDVRKKAFYISKNVKIYGGFSGGETMLSERDFKNNITLLSGDLGTLNDDTDDAYHVLYFDGTTSNNITTDCVLDGFTIEKGNANSSGINSEGGGIYLNGTSSGNESSPYLTNCKLRNNQAIHGGALFISGYAGNSSPQIIACSFSNNTANNGGAIYSAGNFGTAAAALTNCEFFSNHANVEGGVLANDDADFGSPVFTNCTFYDNTAPFGGIISIRLWNSGMVAPKLDNCIGWGNTSTFIQTLSNTGALTIDNSFIQESTCPTGATCTNTTFNTDPLFVDAANGDLRLQNNSPATNAGNNSATGLTGITTDLDNNPRIAFTTVDMGAYENSCAVANGRIYVNINAVAGGGGSSWATALTDLQDGIDLATACDNITEIWVAAGTYLPSYKLDFNGNGEEERERTFHITKNVKIYGGFSGSETMLAERDWVTNQTILSGDIDNTPTDSTGNAYHIMVLNGTTDNGDITPDDCILDGFTLEKGNANGGFPHNRGGAIYQKGDNAGRESSIGIANCSFLSNHATDSGGAIFNSGVGGGNSSPILTNCTFSYNTAGIAGGAFYNDGAQGTSSPELTNCTFSYNTAGNGGGALYNDGQNGTSSPELTNCTFSYNTVFVAGGAITNAITTNVAIENCIFWGNTANIGENEIEEINSTGTTLNYSLIQGTTCPSGVTCDANTIFNTDPLFVDAANGDLRLQDTSPAINEGNNSATGLTGITTDLDNNPRIAFTTVDMGAYENSCAVTNGRIYVNINAVAGGGRSSWATALTDLQDGIDLATACDNITEIWVAAGTYLPTYKLDFNGNGEEERERTFYITKNVKIYGGFSGGETMLEERDWTTNQTILSGDIDNTPNDNTGNTYHIMVLNGTTANGDITPDDCILNGFTLEKGNANGGFPHNRGGAIYQKGDNAGRESSIGIANCSFLSNHAFDAGGAIFNSGAGGGNSSPILTNCAFSYNTANVSGGALFNNGAQGTSSPELTNCTFSYNTANNSGGAISSFFTTNVAIENCIFWGNTATNGGNELQEIASTGTTLNYSLIQGTTCPSGVTCDANTKFNTDPLFVDAANGFLRLQDNSPAINEGNNSATGLTGITTDLDNNPRIAFTTVDMGAYENSCAVANGRIYVNINAAAGGGGSSWATALTDLQDGIDLATACDNITEIWVAAGTYLPSYKLDFNGNGEEERERTFYITKNVKIYGGFSGGETMLAERDWTTNQTILSGDIDNTPTDSTGNTYHIMVLNGTTDNGDITSDDCILDGFTLEKGNADGGFPHDRGGAIYQKGDNAGRGSSIGIANCSFLSNYALDAGGAIFNSGVNGGNSNPILTNCTFSYNTANYGGALYNNGAQGTSSPELTNCTFSYNTAVLGAGGAIRNRHTTNVAIENCIFWGNTATNGRNEIAEDGSTGTTLNYSLIQGTTCPTGVTCDANTKFNTDPLFVDAANGDLRLQDNSPAINEGNNSATGLTGITTDLDNHPRIFNTTVDMGAYEQNKMLTCGEVFTDGPGDYVINLDLGYTICNPSGGAVALDFTSFNLEATFDFLYIFDSDDMTNQIGIYTGTISPGYIISTQPSGCLTLRFTSDGSIVSTGWEANITCCPAPITCYEDSDGDGYGNANGATVDGCETCPSGYAIESTDCNDGDGGDTDISVDNNPITAGDYYANASITSEGTVNAGTPVTDKVTFHAGHEIILEVGFVAEAGSDFQALIDGECSPPANTLVQKDNDEEEEILIKKKATPAMEEVISTDTKVSETAALFLSPNPTKLQANITFTIPEAGVCRLGLYNNTGTLVKLLADGKWMEQGEYMEELETERLPAGIYLVMLHTAHQTITKKLIVLD